MQQKLQEIIAQAQAAIDAVSELAQLDELRVQYLGKKGQLTEIMKTLGQLSAEERPKVGQWINDAKQAVQGLLSGKKNELESAKL
ncbi:MAG: phenylalanine--tRNA ligase subunit alpha, partial [Thiotrichales bacterium]|nr:phenylalanine--tRNA ligase subunit alpha [Thiotrichales bacterium]